MNWVGRIGHSGIMKPADDLTADVAGPVTSSVAVIRSVVVAEA